MLFKFLKIIGIGFILSVSTLANATLIDKGDYTTDTVSGLDWLDWSLTKNHTLESALLKFSDDGWRATTENEASQLISDFFSVVSGNSTMAGTYIYGFEGNRDKFINLLGRNNTVDPDGEVYAFAGGLLYGVSVSSIYSGSTAGGSSRALNWAGQSLVRAKPVSEPAIIALFALGFVGIGFARRRQS
jgi:hypothetical protein